MVENAHESERNKARNSADVDAPESGAVDDETKPLEERRADTVRVGAPEAAVAAGLVPAPTLAERIPRKTANLEATDSTSAFSLPDWTDPPTGQVPQVLLDEGADANQGRTRGPSWRQSSADWEVDEDTLGFFVEVEPDTGVLGDDDAAIAGRGEDPSADVAPFEFDFSSTNRRRRARVQDDAPAKSELIESGSADSDDGAAWDDFVPAPGPRARSHRRRAHRVGRAAPSPEAPPRRNGAVALATGLVLAGLAVACFEAGPWPAMAFAALVLALAAGEILGALRRSGYQPVAFVALAAVPVLVVVSYLKGAIGVPIVLAASIVAAGAWRILVESRTSALDDLSVTAFVLGWVGVPGAIVGLLLNPTTYPHRHGIAYVGAAVALTVAHDVASYLVGSKLGRHRLIPRVSPGKSVEGLVGGTLATLALAGGLVTLVHPFSIATAMALGVIVCVFSPLGDLVESVVKRDLGLKDMGNLLPAHGGISDRIDAMLFVLPATFVLVRLVHIG